MLLTTLCIIEYWHSMNVVFVMAVVSKWQHETDSKMCKKLKNWYTNSAVYFFAFGTVCVPCQSWCVSVWKFCFCQMLTVGKTVRWVQKVHFGPTWLHRIWNRFSNLDRLFAHSLGQTESGFADPWNCLLEQIQQIQDGVSWGEMYVYNTINTVYYALVVKSLEVDKKNVSLGDV